MSLQTLKDQFQDYAKDIKLNIGAVLSEEGAPGLNKNQIFGVALASAYQTKNKTVIQAIETEAAEVLSDEERNAAKAATVIMAQNNVYYRFNHLTEDKEFSKMPAKLRMNVIGRPGIEKLDFELYSLAVSALNACGMCINAHITEVKKAGMTNEGIQSYVRIASVVSAAAQAIEIEQ